MVILKGAVSGRVVKVRDTIGNVCLGWCQQRTTGEVCYGRKEAHSETQPSWHSPTSVGFATSAHAKCAFIVLRQNLSGIDRYSNFRWATQ
jgi:hypothetical protein